MRQSKQSVDVTCSVSVVELIFGFLPAGVLAAICWSWLGPLPVFRSYLKAGHSCCELARCSLSLCLEGSFRNWGRAPSLMGFCSPQQDVNPLLSSLCLGLNDGPSPWLRVCVCESTRCSEFSYGLAWIVQNGPHRLTTCLVQEIAEVHAKF